MAGLYLHIPFCRQRCVYCDFYSTTLESECDRYVELLCHEMSRRRDYLKGERLDTVYLGGGTPSLLKERHLEQLARTWRDTFRIASDAEITLEANPDDLLPEYVQMLRRYSFNRISLGVQTFQDKTLKLLNRRHSSSQVTKAVEACREAGFGNLSVDLIYGLPGENLAQWQSNMEQILALRPEHLSTYLLTYEEGTRLHTMRDKRRVVEMDEEEAFQCYSLGVERLKEAGYDHYEISNFALPGFYSRHNSSYWRGIPYLGCGPSAHSYNGTSRQWNTSDLRSYMEGMERKKTVYEREELDLYGRYNDYIVTRLRTKWGVSLLELTSLFGKDLADYALRNAASWLAEGKLVRQGEILRLNGEGVFVSDAVMSDLLYV